MKSGFKKRVNLLKILVLVDARNEFLMERINITDIFIGTSRRKLGDVKFLQIPESVLLIN